MSKRNKYNNIKSFHNYDLNRINPQTAAQEDTFEAHKSGYNLLLSGAAGSGKTFIGMYLGLRDVLNPKTDYNTLYIVRSIVPTRDIGFLPGTREEKEAVYEAPYKSICDELFTYSRSYENMKKAGHVKFLSTSFIRGITLNNAAIVVDESQNYTFEELSSVITRVGKRCSVIFCGDTSQDDLYRKKSDHSGFSHFINIVNRMPSFATIKYGIDDIVRSGIVKEFLIAKEEVN